MLKRLFLCVLFLFLGFSSNSYGAPQYYTFEGEIIDAWGDLSIDYGLSIGDTVSYSFMVDTEEPGSYTSYFTDGRQPPSHVNISDNENVDYFYAEYLGGSLPDISTPVGGFAEFNNLYSEINAGYSSLNSTGIYQNYDYLEGGTTFNKIEILENEPFTINDWQVGTSLIGTNLIYSYGDNLTSFQSNISLASISDTNPFGDPQQNNSISETYGVFIGYGPDAGLDGNEIAEDVKNSFINYGYMDEDNAFSFTGTDIDIAEIEETFRRLSEIVGPEDELIVYYAGHGATASDSMHQDETTVSAGDEIAWLTLGDYFYDDDLSVWLSEIDSGTEKYVFMDSCHSGGFWGNDNDGDVGDLEKISNLVGLSAASETGSTWYTWAPPFFGYSLFSSAFLSVLDTAGPYLPLLDLFEFISNYPELLGLYGSEVFEMGLGDPAILTEDLWNPVMYVSNDFTGDFAIGTNTAPVPEPSTIVLMGLGLVGLAGYGRKRMKR